MRRKDDLVSVIVPVYNIEDYLDTCLNSIIHQTYRNLEIILVDDGSSDSSGTICENYKQSDDRIVVLHKKNGGLSDARNTGIRIASGNFLTFVDGDDYVSEEYIEKLVEGIYAVGADIAIMGILDVFDSEDLNKAPKRKGEIVSELSNEECLERILYQKNMDLHSCGKLYRREVLKDLYFPKGKLYEDWLFTPYAIGRAKKIAVINEVGYYYVQRMGSISNGRFSLSHLDAIDHANTLVDYISNNYSLILCAAYSRYLSILSAIFMKAKTDPQHKEIQDDVWNEIKKIRWGVLRDHNASFKNRMAALISIFGREAFALAYKCTRKRARMNA